MTPVSVDADAGTTPAVNVALASTDAPRPLTAVSRVVSAGRRLVAAEEAAGASRGVSFIAHPTGDVVPVPEGGCRPDAGYEREGIPVHRRERWAWLDPRTTEVRIMDRFTSGKYQYPNRYASYSNASGQAVNPYTGQTIPRADPFWHWPF